MWGGCPVGTPSTMRTGTGLEQGGGETLETEPAGRKYRRRSPQGGSTGDGARREEAREAEPAGDMNPSEQGKMPLTRTLPGKTK